jgi:hypothetical protein
MSAYLLKYRFFNSCLILFVLLDLLFLASHYARLDLVGISASGRAGS